MLGIVTNCKEIVTNSKVAIINHINYFRNFLLRLLGILLTRQSSIYVKRRKMKSHRLIGELNRKGDTISVSLQWVRQQMGLGKSLCITKFNSLQWHRH